MTLVIFFSSSCGMVCQVDCTDGCRNDCALFILCGPVYNEASTCDGDEINTCISASCSAAGQAEYFIY